MKGWVKFHRKLLDSDLWLAEKFTRGQAWADLIGLANHKDGFIRKRGIKVLVKRGQVGWSEISLSERWKWSRGKVRRFLKELKKELQIYKKPIQQNKFITSLITLINYDQYQADSTADSTADGQQTDSRQYRNKNEKNEKNEKKKDMYTSNFLSFWKEYPRKTGKGAAFKSYQNIKQPRPSLQIIIDSIKEHQKSEQWKNKQFIPNPATWLNQRRWEDEVCSGDETMEEYMKRKGIDKYGNSIN